MQMGRPTIIIIHQDVLGGLDYMKVYATYIASMAQQRVVTLQSSDNAEKKEVQVDLAFLCLAGSLLGLSKYAVMFQEKLSEADQIKDFKQLVHADMEAMKKKQNADIIYKTSILAQVAQQFAKFSKAVESHQNLLKQVPKALADDSFFKKLIERASSLVAQILSGCNDELGAASGFLNESFQKTYSLHEIPSLFQAEQLDKVKIAELVADPATQMLVLTGSKAAKVCEEINATLQKLRELGAPVLTTSVSSMLSALRNDLSNFSGKNQPVVLAKGERIGLASFSYFQGSMTLSQCLSRELRPGETRLGLTKRCLELLANKGIPYDDNLKRRADAVVSGK